MGLRVLGLICAFGWAVSCFAETLPAVRVELFFETGCLECETVKREVFPHLAESTSVPYVIELCNIGITSNYLRLVTYQEALGVTEDEAVSAVVGENCFLNGLAEIRTGLVAAVEAAEVVAPSGERKQDNRQVLRDRIRRFSVPAVLVAGLADGLNPCAISTLIFFMGLLAASGVRGRRMLVMASAFCLSSFITYTLIGLGLLHSLHWLEGWDGVARSINLILLTALFVLAGLSFRDAWRFHRTGKASAVSLKLPAPVMRLIHRSLRRGIHSRALFAGGALAGLCVTVLESVCTGQMYLPALATVIRSGDGYAREWALLLGYNAAFILPLVAVFVLTWAGLGSRSLMDWGRREVVVGKVLLGVLFLTLAALMVLFL